MASKKPTDSNLPLGSVRIKQEPGTSSVHEPLTSTVRLTSFRMPRDLTLGGIVKTEKPKKVYAPNINVQRNKKKDDGAPVNKNELAQSKGRGRGRGRGSDRGRGRGKIAPNLIQSTGVFSLGISEAERKRSYSTRNGGGGADREPRALMEKPKLDLNRTVDKTEEEETLKMLLRDDFIDDGEDINEENSPIILPLIEEVKTAKKEIKQESNIVTDREEEEEEVDRKPIILENGQAVMPSKVIKNNLLDSKDSKEQKETNEKTVTQVIESKSNDYILFVFPDSLPGLQSDEDPSDTRSSKSSKEPVDPKPEGINKVEHCTLGKLKNGLLGKIQIHRSGKACLKLGNNDLILDVGSRRSFRQDVVAAKLGGEENNLIHLGPIGSTIVCSPDWETMLENL